MEHLTREDIKEVVREVMNEHNSSEHHDFLRTLMEERRLKKDRMEKLKDQVYGWATLAFIINLFTWVGTFFATYGRDLVDHLIKSIK